MLERQPPATFLEHHEPAPAGGEQHLHARGVAPLGPARQDAPEEARDLDLVLDDVGPDPDDGPRVARASDMARLPTGRGHNVRRCRRLPGPSRGERRPGVRQNRRMTITASVNCRFGVCFVPGTKNDVPPSEMSFFCFELITNGINMQNRLAEAGAVILECGEQLTASTKFSISKL